MKNKYLLLLILFAVFQPLSAQKFVYKAGVHSFFDNKEFSGSKIQTSQTMSGVHLAPQVGLAFKEKHRIYAGIDLMHEFGSNKLIGYKDLFAYYQLDNEPFRFYMGAFPRHEVLEKYPRMFFQDSIRNYRPTITGLFWELYKEENYLNVWLDWTSRQTETRREAFFMGWSGRYNLGIFYGQHFGYMFHFTNVKNPEVPEGLHDNGLILTSLGIDLAEKAKFRKLELNVGWSVGLERDRSSGNWHTPQGLLSELKVEYRGFGIFNTYYRGRSQQFFYDDHNSELYWGDPLYRASEYNRTDIYINFIKNDVVNVKLTYSLHFVENTIYHQQMLTANFDFGNVDKKESKPYPYLWKNWFKKKK
jgi:hypothetical protein